MNSFFSIVLLKGRLSRVPYALVALPILFVFENSRYIAFHAPVWAEWMGANLANMWPLTAIFIAIELLIIPLIIVSFNRLHDISLTGFLALPYLVKFGVGFYAGWAKLHDAVPGADMQQLLTYISQGAHIYGLALALLLLLVPGRKAPVVCEVAPA